MNLLDSSLRLLSFTTEMGVADGLEALRFSKSNKLYPTYALMQKIWNNARTIQGVMGFLAPSGISSIIRK